MNDDARWMGAALALSSRGRGQTAPNPCVGCIIVSDGVIAGRGWTQPSGRPHAEAMAVTQAGARARGATAYVTLEPCAEPGRGPACADVLIESGVVRIVAAIGDPFSAVDGKGFAKLRAAGIDVSVGPGAGEAARAMAGFLTRQRRGRPHVTLKLALSLDGCIAMADGTSQWITGPQARAHSHIERARHEVVLVGRGTWDADAPALDVRLAGLENRSPVRVILSGSRRDAQTIAAPSDIASLAGDHLLVEGGATTAAAFLREDLVDRLLIYCAPILIGGGRTLPAIGLAELDGAHGRWSHCDHRRLGSDTLDVYERIRG